MPDPQDRLALWAMADLITPLALRVAATLRVADHLPPDGSARPLAELAADAGADRDALGRLLRYLAARGVFVEPAPERFALTPLAGLLRDDHPATARRWLDLEGFGGRMDLAFVDLLATVRDGRTPRPAHESQLIDAERDSFDDLMERQARAQAPAIVAARDWTGARHVVDVGGGSGAQLAALLRAQPHLRGSLVELPRPAERARALLREEGVAERCAIVAGDLFTVELPAADVYLLKFVLHGLDDGDAATALRRCREAAEDGARILVVEGTVAPGDDRGSFTAMDLRMLILGQGRERTREEYAALAERAGLRLVATTPTAAGPHLLELAFA